MNVFLLIAGSLLLCFTLVDLFFTTFSMKSAGTVTSFTTRATWSLLRFLSRRLKSQRMLNNAGMIIIGQTLLQWALLIWVANTLLFLSDSFSILHSQTKLPASLADKIYVAGYTITTMGNGDFVGGSSGWKIYISFSALTGLVVLTVSLSYLVQLLSQVNSKREFSRSVSGIANNPQQLLQKAWHQGSFSMMNALLTQWSTSITALTESHLSYPILHFYYTPELRKSLPVNLCLLDEALSILYTAVPRDLWPNLLVFQSVRESIYAFLQTLKPDYIQPTGGDAPPVPSLEPLRACGMPVASEAEFKKAFGELSERRKLLEGFLQNENRSWQVVYRDHKG